MLSKIQQGRRPRVGQAAKCRIYSESDWLQETIGTVGIVLVISYPRSLLSMSVGTVGRYSGMNSTAVGEDPVMLDANKRERFFQLSSTEGKHFLHTG